MIFDDSKNLDRAVLRRSVIVPTLRTGEPLRFGRGAETRGLVAAAVRIAILALLVSVGRPGHSLAAERIRVMATTTMAADIARSVCGDRCGVECLLAPGIDPHSYRATPRDADRLARADAVVASGLRLEGRLADLLDRLGRRTPVVSIGAGLPADRLIEAGQGIPDPHVWFDAELWSHAPAVVAERLAVLDPGGAEGYRARAAERAARLREAHGEARRRLATIPSTRRVLVTAHDAFRYFGRAYEVEVVGVQGTSTEAEAGLADINRLVDLLTARRIPAVFVETSVSDRNVAALREGARARGHTVGLGGRLYSDSLGGPESGHDTLESALMANVDVIVQGLGGDTVPPAPARPASAGPGATP
ncbi:MAG: manganese transporter [Planctomycetia bacterium]|nr:manganese transporter [Planctomycetia bacterium]